MFWAKKKGGMEMLHDSQEEEKNNSLPEKKII